MPLEPARYALLVVPRLGSLGEAERSLIFWLDTLRSLKIQHSNCLAIRGAGHIALDRHRGRGSQPKRGKRSLDNASALITKPGVRRNAGSLRRQRSPAQWTGLVWGFELHIPFQVLR